MSLIGCSVYKCENFCRSISLLISPSENRTCHYFCTVEMPRTKAIWRLLSHLLGLKLKPVSRTTPPPHIVFVSMSRKLFPGRVMIARTGPALVRDQISFPSHNLLPCQGKQSTSPGHKRLYLFVLLLK